MATESTPTALAAPVDTRMYLLSALAEDGAKTIAELTKLVGEAGAKVEKTEDLGIKQLAFAINQHRQLTLVSVFFLASPAELRQLDSELKHTETIERFLLTDWKADLNAPKRRSRVGETGADKPASPAVVAPESADV